MNLHSHNNEAMFILSIAVFFHFWLEGCVGCVILQLRPWLPHNGLRSKYDIVPVKSTQTSLPTTALITTIYFQLFDQPSRGMVFKNLEIILEY
jgi:hypothetical protein